MSQITERLSHIAHVNEAIAAFCMTIVEKMEADNNSPPSLHEAFGFLGTALEKSFDFLKLLHIYENHKENEEALRYIAEELSLDHVDHIIEMNRGAAEIIQHLGGKIMDRRNVEDLSYKYFLMHQGMRWGFEETASLLERLKNIAERERGKRPKLEVVKNKKVEVK